MKKSEHTEHTRRSFRKLIRKYRYYLLGFGVILIAVTVYLVLTNPLAWVLQSPTKKSRTYPYANIVGKDAGNLDPQSLNVLLAKTKTTFDSHKYSFSYEDARWDSLTKDLGFELDAKSTGKSVWQLNDLSVGNKVRLIHNRKNGRTVMEPKLFVDSSKCQQKVAALVLINRTPTDAVLYYDNQIRIKSDEAGVTLKAADTCQDVEKTLKENKYLSKVAVDSVSANITDADISAKLNQINGLAARPISFANGKYSRTVKPEELLSYLVLSKETGKDLSITWDETKLDKLAAEMASHVDTTVKPSLGSCEVLVSMGGTRLDRQFVKDTIKNLSADKPTSYKLNTYSIAPVTRNRSTVTTGSKGTVYLTYDDGMAYASTIMDYASCYKIKVTFFEIGSRAESDTALLKRAIAEGHAVQSHGQTHAVYDYGTGHDYTWQYNDIKQSVDVITGITGVRPTYFRPPGGNHTEDTHKAATDNGLALITWGVSSADTSNNTTADICRNVVNGARAGSSVLMHSSKQKTANALPCIVEGLAARGYTMQALR